MIILNHNDIINMHIPLKECISILSYVLALHAEKHVLLEKKISLSPKTGTFFNTMPCAIPALGLFATKVINRFPKENNRPGIFGHLLLYDINNGNLLAIMDATWLTAIRTGCIAAITAKHLSVGNDFAFIGLGNTAIATLQVLSLIKPAEKITILEYKDGHNRFKEKFPLHNIQTSTSIEEIIRTNNTIFTSTTFAETPFVQPDWLHDNILAVPIHTRGWQLCDKYFDQVITDDYNHIKHFMPEISAELGDIIVRNKPGRMDNEKIIAYNIGIAIDDLAIAYLIYNYAIKHNIGQQIDLNSYPDSYII